MAEPLISERVPYVIVYGSPNMPLYELVRSPDELIQKQDLKLNYEYYVMKQILPPIDRIMVLMGINCFEWVKNLSLKPKIFQFLNEDNQSAKQNPVSLSNYIYSTDCILCGRKRSAGKLNEKQKLCHKCKNLEPVSLAKLNMNFQKSELKLVKFRRICQMCTASNSLSMGVKQHDCVSMDCPNNFLLHQTKQEFQKKDYIHKVIDEYF